MRRIQLLLLEHVRSGGADYLLRLVARLREMHLQREHRKLLTRLFVPALALTLGAVAAAAGHAPLGGAWLVSLFLLSCLLVALAQQTIP